MRKVLSPTRRLAPLVLAMAAGIAACGSDDTPADVSAVGRPTIVVTTSVWADIVGDAVGDLAVVEVIVPVGADPHEFAPSARQAERMEDADLLIVNGLGLEAGMTDVIANVAATGTPVVTLADTVEPAPTESGADDPHLWLDPSRVAQAVGSLAPHLVAAGLDPSVVDEALAAAVERLDRLDAEIAAALDPIPADRRKLVTNHDALPSFADRYGFEIVGTVIPSVSTSAAPSAAAIERLAALIDELGVPAIFAETTESDALAKALADEVDGPVEIVELYVGSLGPPGSGADTYVGMMTANAERIAAALG